MFQRVGNSNPLYRELRQLQIDTERHVAINSVKNELIIIQGPSFSIWGFSYALDSILACALRLRGAAVLPMYCDGVQADECNVFGGDWNGKKSFKKNCRSCIKSSRSLWQGLDTDCIVLSDFLTTEDYKMSKKIVASLDDEQWMSHIRDGAPLGRWAVQILCNMWTVGNPSLVPESAARGRSHLQNLIVLQIAYDRILAKIKPDRVVSNDSYYGMWAVLERIAREHSIPFFSHWPIGADRVAVARNDYAMSLSFSDAWNQFKLRDLDDNEEDEVSVWLARNAGEGGSHVTQFVNEDNSSVAQVPPDIDTLGKRPMALMAPNVVWDLAALDKQIVFDDMMDWVINTVKWFAKKPEYQLVIRPHPVEIDHALPVTRDRVENVLTEYFGLLPENVFIDTFANRQVQDWFTQSSVVLVHTSTVGLEAAAHGVPVITSGKAPYRGCGFTRDSLTKDNYFSTLHRHLSDRTTELHSTVSLARKFIAFYQFRFYMRHGLLKSQTSGPPILNAKRVEDLLPGNNAILDFIVESILEDKPIVSASRWPPNL